jgi:hypothetical protein
VKITFGILLGAALAMIAGTPIHAAPSNDMFAASELVTGTNITYTGNFTSATSEPGEPFNGAANTVWMTWVAPTDGYAQVQEAAAPQFQYYGIYTGSNVDQLLPVNLVALGHDSIYRFLTTAGTAYHFQFSGGADDFTFYLQFSTFSPCPNDNFTNALVVKGNNISFPPVAINDATMELGEPAHLGDIPQKTVWWRWQTPVWDNALIIPSGSLVSNYVIAVYTGNSVEALTLICKSTNETASFPTIGGQTYYIAAAAPTNAIGDIRLRSLLGGGKAGIHIIPGNVLQEPSWEGTGVLNAQYWKWSGNLNGYVNEAGGVDGTTWPVLSTGTIIWQDVPTILGHSYEIRFAYLVGGSLSSGGGDGQVAVGWDGRQLGVSTLPGSEGGFWHWDDYTVVASNTTSRIAFTNLARNLEMDAFSVVDISAPPAIITQPKPISGISGGSVAFIVGTTGTPPLSYQWFFNHASLIGRTNNILSLDSLTTYQAGNYQVIITNAFGAVTSTVASLVVDEPLNATILSQPLGDAVPVGGYYNFNVVAAGDPPLTYQWFHDNLAVDDATNNNLMLTNVQSTDAGSYAVRVQNNSSTVYSLPAALVVNAGVQGGGLIDFRNQNFFAGNFTNNAPIFDLDGTSPLNGSQYVAQLYAGPSLENLRPAGQPTPFQPAYDAGYFVSQAISLANVAPGSNAVLQVCVWDANYGTSYETVRALGGRFGKSGILEVPAGGGFMPPQTLQGLQSFSLQAGLPFFEVGSISFVERQEPNTIVWALHGQSGSIYLIEKSKPSVEKIWNPFVVLTNVTGTVIFSDTADSGDATVLYRARILD